MMEKQYDSKLHEKKAHELWTEQETYKAKHNPGPLYSIDTPPPTVSGKLHIGHIFSYTQTDISARFARMDGKSVFYPFGFDDNGLATERFVEKKREIVAHQLPRSEFIKICLEESHAAEEQFIQLWRKMGLSVDWDLSYSTIAPNVRKLSQESFIRLVNKGLVYKKLEPALYCTTDRTSVAQAELEDAQVASFFNTIVFSDENGNDLLIGTTRPELLPSCVALFYHPDDKRYTHLAGTRAKVPLFNFTVPVIADEKVEPTKGTGLVMCCTFGDKTDIEWYKKHKLEYKQSIGFDGKFKADIPFIGGLKVHPAREAIIAKLKEQNLLIEQKPIIHSVNIHERCKKEIEYMNMSQWFLNIMDYKKTFIELADQINWYPAYMKSRYQNWVENISWDWCLSRQRFFGIPFPVWYCNKCDKPLIAPLESLPVDPQEQSFPGNIPHAKGTGAPSCGCGSTDLRPDTDVMDTWNTSSITPYICASLHDKNTNPFETGIEEFLPMAMRPQAHDIIRTWAFYTIVKSWMHDGIIPWKDIVISGHVLAGNKEKISKSQGNNPLEPENLLNTYSADVIRYWTATGSLGTDIAFSDTQLKIGQRLVTKLWNAFRFVEEHLSSYKPTDERLQLGLLNEWIIHQTSECYQQYRKYFEQHEFGLALDRVEHCFWHNFCDNYLELIKDQLFKPELYSPEIVKATKATLYHVALRILQMYAPYIPHVTETLYQLIYKKEIGVPSLHQTKFSALQSRENFMHAHEYGSKIIALVQQIRKLKTERQLSLKTGLQTLTIGSLNPKLIEQIRMCEQTIKGVSQAISIVYQADAEAIDMLEERADGWHMTVSVD